jgi:hypothetical protein
MLWDDKIKYYLEVKFGHPEQSPPFAHIELALSWDHKIKEQPYRLLFYFMIHLRGFRNF